MVLLPCPQIKRTCSSTWMDAWALAGHLDFWLKVNLTLKVSPLEHQAKGYPQELANEWSCPVLQFVSGWLPSFLVQIRATPFTDQYVLFVGRNKAVLFSSFKGMMSAPSRWMQALLSSNQGSDWGPLSFLLRFSYTQQYKTPQESTQQHSETIHWQRTIQRPFWSRCSSLYGMSSSAW